MNYEILQNEHALSPLFNTGIFVVIEEKHEDSLFCFGFFRSRIIKLGENIDLRLVALR